MSDGMTIEQAMHREQELLRPLREHADFVIDTTLMPAAKLRNELYGLFGDKSARGKLSVNVGGATCADVLTLIEKVQKAVYDAHGVMLEPEVKIIR